MLAMTAECQSSARSLSAAGPGRYHQSCRAECRREKGRDEGRGEQCGCPHDLQDELSQCRRHLEHDRVRRAATFLRRTGGSAAARCHCLDPSIRIMSPFFSLPSLPSSRSPPRPPTPRASSGARRRRCACPYAGRHGMLGAPLHAYRRRYAKEQERHRQQQQAQPAQQESCRPAARCPERRRTAASLFARSGGRDDGTS